MVQTSGSRIGITVDGKVYNCRGEVTRENVGGIETEIGANTDGSSFRTVKAVPQFYNVKFSDRDGIDYDTLAMADQLNVTIDMLDRNEIHLLTGCAIHGTFGHNLSSGEVDGVKFGGGIVQVTRK